jgi:hypothetical protein
MRKSRLTDLQLVAMDKGLYAKLKPDTRSKPWLGGAGPIVDQVQSDLNHKLGYW